MSLDPIALAVPVFFLLIGLELLIARARRQRVYRFTDSFADLGCGVAQRVVLLLFEAGLLAVYQVLYVHGRLWTFAEDSLWPWVIAAIGVDLGYYWWHRLSHEVNVLWAVHVVHHQSEDYNLAVALRQAVLSPITVMPFYLPLAVLGVPLFHFFIVNALSTLYQFWIHTELVGRMGFFEKLINTPSLHRVHHAVNPQYLDKNYAATFICWDQMFGTLKREDELPVYGVSHPLRSFDPVWAQVQPLWALVEAVRRAPSAREAVRFLFASPAWHPAWLGPLEPRRGVDPEALPKYDVRPGRGRTWYVGVQLTLIIVVAFALLTWHKVLSFTALAPAVAWVLVSLVAGAALLEGRRWAVGLEMARVGLLVGAVAVVLLVPSIGPVLLASR
ncbi:MAG TPA: sterol desaturase family protein [Myxococcaceae bacterium]|nr:sterol desaturase family protein [Myxococcaceae bacterium]